MPVRVYINQKEKWIFPNKEWKTEVFDSKINSFELDRNFYIDSRDIKP